jgi:hypothetical protein
MKSLKSLKSQTINRLIIAGVVSAIALSLIPSSQVAAREKRSFSCEKVPKQGTPRTYTLYKRQKYTVIRWAGALGGKTPQERCEQASSRLQEAYDNETLNIITNGMMNKKPVICTASDYGGNCVNLLISLNPKENSLQVLNELKEALLGNSMGPIIHTSGVPQLYYQIDLEQALKNAPVERQ